MLCYIPFLCIILSVFPRITDVAYKVFFDAIETQGRALLRVPLVRLRPHWLSVSKSQVKLSYSLRTSTISQSTHLYRFSTTPKFCAK